jgi:hypothetical protein
MANRFWVGGAGTWDDTSTANWSATTGGASGASAPTAADTAIFDANSGSGTITVAATAVSGGLTIGKSDITLQLNGDVVLGSTAGISLTAGVLDLNGYSISGDLFVSTSANARTVAFGSTGKIICTRTTAASFAVDLFNATTQTTLTGTPVIEFTGNFSAGIGVRPPNNILNPPNIFVTTGTGAFTLGSGFSFGTVNFTGFSGSLANTGCNIYGNFILSSTMTVTAGTGVLVFAATSGTQQVTTNGVTFDRPITQNGVGGTVQLQDNLTMGSTRAYTLTAGALDLTGNSGNWTLTTWFFSSNNSNTRSIAFGTGNITCTGNNGAVWNMGSVVGFSYTGTPTVNLTYSGSVGSRSVNGGNIFTGGGTEFNCVSFNITAGTDTIALGSSNGIKNINFTGFAGTRTNTSITIFGSCTFSSGMTLTAGANAITYAATSGTQQITVNGQTLDFPLIFNGIGGTFAFQDALTQGSTRAFTVTNGTVQLKNGVTSTVGSFVANNSSVKFLQSTTPGSQATLSQASGTVNVVDLTIRDINAVGGASWNAYTDFENTDAGNNDGWNFSLSPPYSTAELPITLRPFTQPRRF